MKTRGISKQFNPIINLGFKNILVGGSSFTWNNHETIPVAWPYYLRDFVNATEVFDCSMPGSGNYHISSSIQWSIETQDLNPSDTLVVIMWSGCLFDDAIVDSARVESTDWKFNYTSGVSTAISAGTHPESRSNLLTTGPWPALIQCKSVESRSIENFIYISSLYNSLKAHGYQTVFLEQYSNKLPMRFERIDMRKHLPNSAVQKLNHMISPVACLYDWALKNVMLDSDDFHPSVNAHLQWTKQCLVPYLKNKLNAN